MAETNGVGALTEAEQKYLDSGGQDSAAMVAELQPKTNGADAPAAPAPAPAKAADEGKPAAATPPADAAAASAAAATATAAAAATVDEPEVGEEDVATPDGKGKRRMVDSRALKAARTKTKELETKLEEERQARVKDNEARAVVNERLRLLTEAVSTPAADTAAAEPETPPDPQEDIFGAVTHLGKEIQELRGKLGQVTEQTAEERAAAQTVNSFRADAGNFARQQPDFMDAYNHLFLLRKQQLELQGYSAAEVNTWLFREEMHLIDRSLKAGKSPAQQIYALSKTMGYAPKAPPATDAAAAAAAQTNGHAAPAAATPALALAPTAAAATPAGNVSDEIDRIKAGQAAARSLSNGSGGGGDELSIEALANMPMADFEKLVKSKAGAVERALGRTN